MKFLAFGIVLLVCSLTKAAPSYYHQNKGHATSYAVITKHEAEPHHDWEHKSWAPIEHKEYVEDDLHKYDDYDKHAKYEFDYGVQDLKTGDIKNQWEHRNGDHVKGAYSLKEADGTTRIVEYTADGHNGFNAVVKNIGHAHHPELYVTPALHHDAYDIGYDHGLSHASSYAKVWQY